MIGVTFQGRLGNQLFQYAFAFAKSKDIRVGFYMDQSQQRAIIYDYFELDKGIGSLLAQNVFKIKGFKNLFSHYLREAIYRSANFWFTNNQTAFGFENYIQPANITNNSLVIGYFQSESYFINHSKSLKELFKVKKKWHLKHSKAFEDMYHNRKIATVHIRKSDYQNLANLNLGSPDLSLPFSYYHQVIAQLKVDDYFFIFTSDEPEKIDAEFSYLKNKYISYDDEITDFQHMLNANVCIIANSTFSWWAAYLNEKPDKAVFCPEYFLGFHIQETVPRDIYPKEWVRVSIAT